MFAIVGQVERPVRGREAFQEIDQVATLGGLAKWAVEPATVDEVPDAVGRGDPPGARRPARAGPAVARRGPARRADRRTMPGSTRSGRAVARATDEEIHDVIEFLGLGPPPGDPGRRGRPARPDLDRADAVRRAAPGPGHRRLATRRHHLERPRRCTSGWPASGRPRPSASGWTPPTPCSSSGRDSMSRRPTATRCPATGWPGRMSTSSRAAARVRRPDDLGHGRRQGVPQGGQRAAPRPGRPRRGTRRRPAGAQRRRIEPPGRPRRPSTTIAVGRPGRPSGAHDRDAPPGPARRRDPDHGCRQLRELGGPRLPVPPARHVPRSHVRGDGLRPAGRHRRRAGPSRSSGRRAGR